jgi:hypothetical protein
MFTIPTEGEGKPREGRVETLFTIEYPLCSMFRLTNLWIEVKDPKLV